MSQSKPQSCTINVRLFLRGQISLEFLALLAIMLTYIAASIGLWNYGIKSINEVATGNTVLRISENIDFYAKMYAHSKGKRTIELSFFPGTRAAIISEEGGLRVTVKSCGRGGAFYEKTLQMDYPVRSTLPPLGADCDSYPLGQDSPSFIIKHIAGHDYVEVAPVS